MRNPMPADSVLWPAKPKRGWLTADVHQVAVVMWDGTVDDVFWADRKKMRDGRGPFYLASTAPFEVAYSLKASSPGEESSGSPTLDQSVYTSDAQPVMGQLTVGLSLAPERVERLLPLRGRGQCVTSWDIALAIKNDCATAVADVVAQHTASDLQGKRQAIRESIRNQLAAPAARFGLQCGSVYPNLSVITCSTPPVITRPKPPVITRPTPPVITRPTPPVITRPTPPQSAKCQTFSRAHTPQAEERFQAWMRANPTGYVFNHFRGSNPGYNLLHQLPCPSFQRQATTAVQKFCCTDRACIERTIRELRGESWQLCGNGCCPG